MLLPPKPAQFSKLDWQDVCHFYRIVDWHDDDAQACSLRSIRVQYGYRDSRAFELVYDEPMAFDIAAESLLGDCGGCCRYTDTLTLHSRYDHMAAGAGPCTASYADHRVDRSV